MTNLWQVTLYVSSLGKKAWTRRAFPVCVAVFLFAGCMSMPLGTSYHASDALVSGYPPINKIPLQVELYLSNDLRAGKAYNPQSEEASARYLGVMLARNAEAVTREVFTTVVTTDSSDVAKRVTRNAVLIPRLMTVEPNEVSVFGPETLTIRLEWTLKDENGNIIWTDIVKGKGQASLWPPLIDQQRSNQIAAMLRHVFHQSFTALSSSPEIREFATNQQKPSVAIQSSSDSPQATTPHPSHFQSKDGLVIGIKPLTDSQENEKYFDIDLLSRGVLAIFVSVHNQGEPGSFILLKERFTLQTAQREEHTVKSLPQRKPSVRDTTQHIAGTALTGVGVVAFIVSLGGGGLLGAPFFYAAEKIDPIEANEARTKTKFEWQELPAKTISLREDARGFVYFPRPPGFPGPGQWVLHLEAQDINSKEVKAFDFILDDK